MNKIYINCVTSVGCILLHLISPVSAGETSGTAIASGLQLEIEKIGSPEEAVAFLSTRALDTELPATKRIEAISLLGNYRDEASVTTLITCISVRSAPSIRSPAHKALGNIGEYAFSKVLDALNVAVKTNASKETKADLVRGLMVTKGRGKYEEWGKANLNALDDEVHRTIVAYSLGW